MNIDDLKARARRLDELRREIDCWLVSRPFFGELLTQGEREVYAALVEEMSWGVIKARQALVAALERMRSQKNGAPD